MSCHHPTVNRQLEDVIHQKNFIAERQAKATVASTYERHLQDKWNTCIWWTCSQALLAMHVPSQVLQCLFLILSLDTGVTKLDKLRSTQSSELHSPYVSPSSNLIQVWPRIEVLDEPQFNGIEFLKHSVTYHMTSPHFAAFAVVRSCNFCCPGYLIAANYSTSLIFNFLQKPLSIRTVGELFGC